VCALVFGKEEDGGGFDFSQDSIDTTVNYVLQAFSGALAPFNPLLPPHFFRIWVPLTISDKNKHLLMQSPDLTKMLIEGLLLDPEHIRQSQDPAIKAQIQCDAAECFAQLALFEPARDMLRDDPVVLDALRVLVSEAATEAAKQSAEGALMSLDPQAVVREFAAESLHVMMSCRCTRNLQQRKDAPTCDDTFITMYISNRLLTDCLRAQTSGRFRRL
jgi:hypothetical protein